MTSQTLKLKISKTKKRLSDTSWMLPLLTISVIGLFGILTFALRATSVTWSFGLVDVRLPIYYKPFEMYEEEKKQARFASHVEDTNANTTLNEDTVVVVLNDSAFYFGGAEAFTKDYNDIQKRFVVPHYDGAPQVQKLLEAIKKWRGNLSGEKDNLLLFAAPDWPVAVIVQIIHYFNQSKLFKHVVLGGGFASLK